MGTKEQNKATTRDHRAQVTADVQIRCYIPGSIRGATLTAAGEAAADLRIRRDRAFVMTCAAGLRCAV